jgi:hypothetical protein
MIYEKISISEILQTKMQNFPRITKLDLKMEKMILKFKVEKFEPKRMGIRYLQIPIYKKKMKILDKIKMTLPNTIYQF